MDFENMIQKMQLDWFDYSIVLFNGLFVILNIMSIINIGLYYFQFNKVNIC